jgi:hypothetical protein
VSGLRLRQRDRRALTVGTAILVPALLFTLGIRPFADALSQTREQLAVQRGLLGRELALLAEAEHYPELMDRAEEVLEAKTSRLLPGADEVTATARLAGYLGMQTRRSRVLLQQSESRPSEVLAESILAVEVELRALGDLEGLLSFLHALETGETLVRVERLAIERQDRSGGVGPYAADPLVLSATVRGFAVQRAAADRAASTDVNTATGDDG